VAVGARRRAGEHRDGRRQGLGELVAGSSSAARLALERVSLQLTVTVESGCTEYMATPSVRLVSW
jgi:hypothetical protein